MQLEIRTAVHSEIKDLDESKRQVLTTFPHDVVDSFKTTFGTDAFRDSFEQRMPVVCWQHDLKEPIGRTISAQATAQGNELVGQLSDFDAVPLARRAFTQMQDGSLTDTSFGFIREADGPHPEHRGVTRITRATMREWSPVTIGSIPGAVVTGTRSEPGELLMPTIDDILRLQTAGVLTDEEVRAAVAKLPEWREHIHVHVENRAPAPAADEDTNDLAAAVDAALDEAIKQFAMVADTSTLPEPVQQAIALVQAASTAVDELLDALGVPDPDDDDNDGAGSGNGKRAAVADYKPKPYHSDGTDAVDCPRCHKGNAPDARYCDQCGDHMVGQKVQADGKEIAAWEPKPYSTGSGEPVTCPHCGKGDDDDAAYCDQCGYHMVGKTVEVRSEDDLEERAAPMTVSKKPWSDFKPGDYTPAQWQKACLIWQGPAGEKSGGSLPVLEPDGTPNANAMAAAAGRLNQTKAPAAAIQTAARKLLSLYGQAKMKAPGSVLQATHAAERSDENLEIDQAEAHALEVFTRHGMAT